MNANFAALVALIDNYIARDGTGANSMLANLDLNHFKVVNLADGVANTDAVTVQQLHSYVTSITTSTSLVDGAYNDITISGGGTVMTIGAGKVTLAKMANLASNSILGNNTGAGTTPIALTGTQVTAMLSAFVGDSGSGGTKGLVPAPASGDAAANKFLNASGNWAVPPGGGGGAGTTTNPVTFNNGGAGSASGITFNGGSAITISYNSIGAAPTASPTFTGTVTIPTPTGGDNSTKAASTAFVVTALGSYAPLASPTLTGTPLAPTAAPGTSTTQIATTAFSAAAIAAARLPVGQTITSSATVTPTFSDDFVEITAQAAGLTLANPTGTAANMWGVVIRIKDNGTAQTIAYGTNYRAVGVTLPAATVISKTLVLGMIFNNALTKWDVISVAQEA